MFDLKKGRHTKAVELAKDARIAKLEEAVAQKDAKLAQKNEVISELMEENILAKSQRGALKGRWVPPDTRDEVIDYGGQWTVRAELPAKRLRGWIGLPTSKYRLWRQHYGRPHAHNARIPRDGWLEAWKKQAIIDYHRRFPLEGNRRLAYIMLDQDVVAVSPTSVYRVLKGAGLLERWHGTLKGEAFRNKAPRDVEEARRVVGNFVTYYNEVRLHSAFGYVTPHDKLAGRDTEIFDSRDSKLEGGRAKRLGAKSGAAEQANTLTVLMWC